MNFVCLKATIYKGSLFLPCQSKLDFMFVQCLMLGIGILTGIASDATEINPFQGRTLRLLNRNPR